MVDIIVHLADGICTLIKNIETLTRAEPDTLVTTVDDAEYVGVVHYVGSRIITERHDLIAVVATESGIIGTIPHVTLFILHQTVDAGDGKAVD